MNKTLTKPGYADLDGIFHPESVAVVGASEGLVQMGLLRPFVTCGFPGKIYPVNHNGGEVLGLKVYKSIKDIPGRLDYVVFVTPASTISSLLEECAAKGVKAASFFTAGFGESGCDEGKALQEKIVEIARREGVRLIGPNCLGIYCPAGRISYIPDPPLKTGPVGFISQSGGNAVYIIRAGDPRGLGFSKVVSYGNGVDIDESELLEYMAGDDETEIIGLYIEGVKNGRRFLDTLKKAASRKPVIILKGGCTDTGKRAALSHTGSIAGSKEVWDSTVRESGAMTVNTMEDMVDYLVTFTYMPKLHGNRVGIAGWGGGASVQAADICEGEGFSVPPFPEELQRQMAGYWLRAGSILGNPVDTVSWTGNPDNFRNIIKCAANWDGIDILMLQIGVIGGLMGMATMLEFLPKVVDSYIDVIKAVRKPAAIVLHSNATAAGWEAFYVQAAKCREAGIPVYHSLQGAARALNAYYRYCSLKNPKI
ncbi:MAG: CoA-binding protein [Dehalococcoidia bacterium]|nr:CoA-binding protein [Dehalococcoidia bacterium]